MLSSQAADAQRIDALGPQVRNYVSVGTPKVILEHVQVIDGTGVAAVADHNISIQEGKITTISPGTDLSPTEGTTILNLRGYSVMPGIVGTHNHLFYLALPNFGTDGSFDSSPLFPQMSFRRLACIWRTARPPCARRVAPKTMRDKGIFLDFTPTFYDGFWSKIHETITVSPFPTLQKSGVPALDIIRSVTTSAAEMLGWQDRVGAVEPGKSSCRRRKSDR